MQSYHFHHDPMEMYVKLKSWYEVHFLQQWQPSSVSKWKKDMIPINPIKLSLI